MPINRDDIVDEEIDTDIAGSDADGQSPEMVSAIESGAAMSPRMAAQPVRMPQKARSKYRAVKETVDGITFHSKAEARRYAEIKLLEKAGEIWELELQPKFPLKVPSTSGYLSRALQATAGDGLCQIGLYIADFKYHDRAGTVPYVVEDVKGHATPLYKWKKKHVEAQYGVTIVEIRRRG